MKTKQDIYNKLNDEVVILNKKVNHVRIYNLEVFLKRTGIKAISLIHRVAPFVIASFIISTLNFTGKKPFERGMVEEHAIVSTVDTSSGFHLETSSVDYDYDDKGLEYTTGWEEKDGYYSRTIYVYEVSDKVDLNDMDSILKMSNEELKELLVLTNIKTITKPKLTKEDEIFTEPAVVINSFHKSEDIKTTREETDWEVFLFSFLYIVLITMVGTGITTIEHVFTKKKIESKLGELKARYKRISSSELADLKALLEVKKANLDLITDSQDELQEMTIAPRKVRL